MTIDDCNSRFIDAARIGNINTVENLLTQGVDVHADNDAALVWASYNGHMPIVKILLEHGADLHARNESPLRQAVHNGLGQGHDELVRFLIGQGADLQAVGDYLLTLASSNGYSNIIRILVTECGLNPKVAIDNPKCNTEVREWCQKYLEIQSLSEKLNSTMPYGGNQHQQAKL